jgi:predicted branched-subunit amino acid permease
MTVAVVFRPNEGAARHGVTAMAPFVVGYAPFALTVGAVVAGHGDRIAGWTGSWLIYGGSAHLSTLRTLDRSGLLLAILAGALVNAR